MAVYECRGIERGERARWFWMRMVSLTPILWERHARGGRFGSFTRGVAMKFSPSHQKRVRARKPERRGVALSKKREKFRFVCALFSFDRCGVSREILTSFFSLCSDIEQFNKKSPGSPSPPRRRPSTKSVSKPPHLREKNQPGTPSSKSAAPNNSSPRADITSATPYRAWNQGPRWLLRES